MISQKIANSQLKGPPQFVDLLGLNFGFYSCMGFGNKIFCEILLELVNLVDQNQLEVLALSNIAKNWKYEVENAKNCIKSGGPLSSEFAIFSKTI